ncbi:hypothetical protein CA54_61590 [Symmachiella macrocystis]|uniref:YMGG-like Gly-zipper domain-containing protein n=1 Tax=Symmachiella macrocystis TaxID=2527985 RepID=A0A5C6ASU7_9PLAN|nr:hypothetical protein CA54_61590 [Symmachiella macrocystis]
MARLRFAGLVILVLVLVAPDLMAQRRRGGAIRGGIRGAMVGGLVGGHSGARRAARAGAVVGGARRVARRVDRRAMYTESRSRTQYQSTTRYQSSRRSNFYQSRPNVIVTRNVRVRR